MTAFVWTICAIAGFEVVAKALVLGLDLSLERSKVTVAIDMVIGMGLLMWGVYLIAKG